MKAKSGYPGALVLGLLCACLARGQDAQVQMPGNLLDEQPAPQAAPEPLATNAGPAPASAPAGVSNWITYAKPGCCGPLGGNGPIHYEIYAYTGPDLPFGGGKVAESLEPGWDVQLGGRSLFFNTYQDAAWTVDLSLSYQYNHANHPELTFALPTGTSYLAVLNRTNFNAALGKEFYLVKAADGKGFNWRVGLDIGGRYGSVRADMYTVATPTVPSFYFRNADVLGAAFTSLHTDLEIPWGCCTFLAGFRAEYNYSFMDLLPGLSDVQDVNFLATGGIRF